VRRTGGRPRRSGRVSGRGSDVSLWREGFVSRERHWRFGIGYRGRGIPIDFGGVKGMAF
jgi:hypothetical protein